MAQMLPIGFDDSTPPGERDVFGWLSEYGPPDWIVLHQLDLAPWNNGRKTEIDFLVIMPQQGLLTVEVKSHEHIRYDEAGWHLNAEIHRRGPFKQADDARKTLERRIRENVPALGHVPICRLVMFPRAIFAATDNAEYRAYELFDRSRCLSAVENKSLPAQMHEAHKVSVEADGNLRSLGSNGLSSEELASLLVFLRPIRCRFETDKRDRELRRQQLDAALRQQQKPVISLAETNPRLIVKGGAGTGKTFIAIELAKRAAEDGLRTGLFCFNRPVGAWMEAYLQPRLPNLVVGPFLKTLARLCDLIEPEGAIWECDDEAIATQITARCEQCSVPSAIMFNRVIVDEAQDILCRPWLMKCLDVVLRKGIVGGSWVLLGDTDFQVLGSDNLRQHLDNTLKHAGVIGNPAVVKLDENCRNFGIVAKAALDMAGITDRVYDGFRRGAGSAGSLKQEIYNTDDQQLVTLQGEIAHWRKQGIPEREIAVLTTKPSVAEGISARLDPAIKRRGAGQPGHSMVCATVGEFKGLEAQAVIVTDLDMSGFMTDNQHRDLFYTAVTRATYGVSLLMTPRAAKRVLSK